MKNFKTLALTAVLAGVAALPAYAEGYEKDASGKTASEKFKALDADKSGSLSEAEFSKHTSASVSFNDADANADGRLTLSELQAVEQPAEKTPAR